VQIRPFAADDQVRDSNAAAREFYEAIG